MIEIHVKYYFENNEKRDAFYKEAKEAGVIDASRAEAGNIRYDYYYPIEEEKTIFLLEQWKNASSTEVHNAAEHFAHLQKIKEKFVEKTEIIKYMDVK